MRPAVKKYICISDADKEDMLRKFRLPQSKVVSIPNAVNRVTILGKTTRLEAPRDERLRILSVGRLSYQKNLLLSIKAIDGIDDIPLIYNVIGDGPQMAEAKEMVGDSDNIRLLGALPREVVFSYIEWADIIVVPSLWEGRSIFVLEAAAFDKPFIISNTVGLRSVFNEEELNEDETFRVCKFGYLVHTNDAGAYGSALRHFYAHPEIHREMKEFVRQISMENDIDRVCRNYIEAFQSVL